ncbi:aldo/keto reductase [Globomyces pollinis-pini]|nr:aldo/keto reductase [Globomyces pollinis-pini]
MNNKKLEMTQSTFEMSKLVFGTWRLADKHSKNANDILLRIKKCLQLGITTFDLADIYGGYTYEELFGKALALEPSLRSQMQIISKCNIQYPCGEREKELSIHYYDTSKSYILKSVDRSLQKIGIDYLDVLLLHRPDPLMDADEVAEAFNELKSSGKVRHFGVSNFTPSQFELIQSRLDFPLVTNQIEFSVLHTNPIYDGTFDQLQRLRVAPMIWSPLAGGKLFGEPSTPQETRVIAALNKVAKELGSSVTIDQVAYAWILQHPTRLSVIVGTNDLARLENVHHSLTLKLTKPQWFYILEASNGAEVP